MTTKAIYTAQREMVSSKSKPDESSQLIVTLASQAANMLLVLTKRSQGKLDGWHAVDGHTRGLVLCTKLCKHEKRNAGLPISRCDQSPFISRINRNWKNRRGSHVYLPHYPILPSFIRAGYGRCVQSSINGQAWTPPRTTNCHATTFALLLHTNNHTLQTSHATHSSRSVGSDAC
jgi:hypothetical protein